MGQSAPSIRALSHWHFNMKMQYLRIQELITLKLSFSLAWSLFFSHAVQSCWLINTAKVVEMPGYDHLHPHFFPNLLTKDTSAITHPGLKPNRQTHQKHDGTPSPLPSACIERLENMYK